MDGRYFRVATFEKWNPNVTPGSKWVQLSTKIVMYGEDFRETSDAAKLTFLALLAAAPKQRNVFPNETEALRVILGIEAIKLDELLDGEYISVIDEQSYFEGYEAPEVAQLKVDRAHVDELIAAWNEMASMCNLTPRTRVKYRGSVWKQIMKRFSEPDWVENYKEALDRIPHLQMLTKAGSTGTSNWRANFDWFSKPESVDRILNGKYGEPLPSAGVYYDDDIDI